ncbi:membrane protein [Mesobacillus campisalis]|uniref:Membrane protein n=1 Tax=Mesobacillus campisalis TaxID=1408103 RepID=A0A0M2SXC4_9BACI|nr:CidA/LrgA family holin-like protein [Mesobacillus campisalis]KKK39229.1 membrane protein [Mesobacillus campisalis]
MKILTTVFQFGILYLFYFIGSYIQNYFHLAIPGSIIGLLLLFICLCLKIVPVKLIENGATFLLSILVLLFVPTTVGIMNYPSLLSIHGVLLVAAILLSTGISIAIAGTAIQFFEKKGQKRTEVQECNKLSSRSA